MRNGLPSPLSGIRSPFGLRDGVSIYAILGFEPPLVFDFENELYRTGGTKSTFSDSITYTGASNKTMVDSDGLLKWAPHNLVLNSATPATQSITVVSGADYTVECTGVSIALSGAGTGTVTEGNPVTITASTTTLTLTVTGSTGTMWAYRSDLGGMVDNPDRGDSYVPTTSAARYLPRRGHHVYNGAEWVNEGVLVEPSAATNRTQENDSFTSWEKTVLSIARDSGATSPDGKDAWLISVGLGATNYRLADSSPVATATDGTNTSCLSVYLKQGSTRYAVFGYGGGQFAAVVFDFDTASVVASSSNLENSPENFRVSDEGNGWYRVSFTVVGDGAPPSRGFSVYPWNLATAPSALDLHGETASADSNDTLYIAFPQIEISSVPTSIIPTSGSTVTRAADTLTVPSANLPWPTPNVIGPELVTNGTFDTDVSGWSDATTGASTFIWNDGAAELFKATGEIAAFYQNLSLTPGSVYQLTWADSGTGGTVRVGTSVGSQDVVAITSSKNVFFVAAASTTLQFNCGTNGATAIIDNISVREIDPLAVSIQMEGRATGDTLTTTRWYLDANNYITQEINTSDFTFEQASAGTVDAVTGGSFTSGVNTSFNIASRHGSTFINGAVDGTALTADTTPTALPDLSTTDLSLAYSGGPMILKKVRIFADDIGDSGLEESTS